MAGLKPFLSIPKNLREWSQWCRNTTVTPNDNTVTEAMLVDGAVSNRVLRDSAANSVIGNPTGTAADPSDIVASADNKFLVRRSGALQFDALSDADIPASIARDTEVSDAITAHEAAADPHPTYTTAAELSSAITTALTNITSGTYTPTLTTVTNMDAATAYSCQYMRVGSVVTVSGRVDFDPTAAGLALLRISLPIASNFANSNECAGTAFSTAAAGQGAGISADTVNDAAYMQFIAVDGTNRNMYFSFTYRVI